MPGKYKIDTHCVVEYDDQVSTKPHILPIYATSSFEMEGMDEAAEIFKGKNPGHVYGRYGNPTIDTTAKKIADLEGFGLGISAYAFMTSSGMSAISVLVQSILKSGSVIITQEDLYGGTTELFKTVFSQFNITTSQIDLNNHELLEQLLKKDAIPKVVYIETPSNPVCTCIDIEKVVTLCKKYDVMTIVDNTFCTPMIQQPFGLGADFIIHSTTKYLNGHGNSIAGVIVGHNENYRASIGKFLKLIGATCNPFDAWLVYNGLKTLGLRMERHSLNAKTLADYLNSHPKINNVNYVGLPNHKGYEIAKKQMKMSGGMLSFEVKGGFLAAKKLMNALRLATYAPTLGDVNTLVLHPRTSSHLNVNPEICEKNGITEGLIRVSVGIENISDIIRDFSEALEKI
ncbi:MAG: aminotransferase class I/II-fold pyridoxal phosphate-dependent enzyme [Saprospiraceae bacterium]|nr:aminotransferase class I/II-fold pyridoxal phosphate-dependent enzyme [Saprospiraceae bacterium]MBP6694181.1 aminotransferase class I/II-fold pyridoxal phosphate-dependent enzyme [Saprospiraceae bacterium]